MVSGAPEEARWMRSEPRRTLSLLTVERMIETVLPRRRVLGVQRFPDSLRNTNFRISLDSTPELVVLRIYEHDSSLCQKEIDLFRLIGSSVPVPEVIGAKPHGSDDLPPLVLMSYVEGLSFRELKKSGDAEAIAQAAYSAGETLAAVSRFSFSKPGWLAPGPAVTKPLLEGADPLPHFVDLCLGSEHLRKRVPADLRDQTSAFLWSWAAQLATLDSATNLVHGDFNKRNLLVRCIAGRWSVAAVLDWEFAISSSPLVDFGNFLRYERAWHSLIEPHFSTGYLNSGGTLPENWRQLSQVIDLVAICESLTHTQLRRDVVVELVDLLRRTVENCAPP